MNPKVSLGLEITLICAGLLSLWLVLDYQYAHALNYTEFKDLEQKVGESEIQFKETSRQIVDLKVQIRQLEYELETQERVLNNTRTDSKTNWNAIPKIELMERSVASLGTIIDEKKTELSELEVKRQGYYDTAEALNEQYQKGLLQRAEQNKFDPSGYTKLIGISLSESCTELIRNNYNHTCPTYRQLYQLDSSNLDVSGKFGVHDGLFSRGDSNFKQSWRWYDTDPTLRIIVDPPAGQRDRIKMITIENNFHTYFELEDRLVANNTRTFQEWRFVDNCHNAVINSGNWTSMLPDTINYLRGGCVHTLFNDTKSVVMNSTEWNPIDSPNYQYRLWLENAIKNCLGLC
ncbi:MAG: hypothetical protein ACE5Q4_04455 [Nitrosopumilus sp.]|jgi:hypothetical protein